MKDVLMTIVQNDRLHARWLNTLSYLENTGARKISTCENDYTTDIVQLKHAAEEHRHAYYLKKQISKLDAGPFVHYENKDLFAPVHTKQYLQRLDLACCRYLGQHYKIIGNRLKYAAYLFVTYAIEVRADELYPVYQEVLSALQSKVMVKSIIVEEEGHLEEMIHMLQTFDANWERHANTILDIEKELFSHWFHAVTAETFSHESINSAMA